MNTNFKSLTTDLRSFYPTILGYLLISACFVFLYAPVLLKLIHDWEVDPNYSHGYFIPFMAAFMIWYKRKQIIDLPINPNNWGLIIILFGLIQLLVSWIGSEYFLQGTSIIVVLLGLSLFLYGKDRTKILIIPLAYLIFMIPLPAIIWNKIAFPLALFASTISAGLIDNLGMTILREGNILSLPNITLQVADACSGLRSLTTLLALSGFIAFISPQSNIKKWIIFLAAVPIAIICNIFRLTVTAILARYFGSSVAEGFIHEFSGWLVFVLGLGLLMGVQYLLGKISVNPCD